MSNLLIVEDMPDALSAYAMGLRMAGHTVLAFTEPLVALEAFAAETQRGCPFDLVILDLAMPGMNGFTVAERIRASCPDQKIVFLTAYDEPLSVGRAETSGAAGFWSKPITTLDLCTRVAQVVNA